MILPLETAKQNDVVFPYEKKRFDTSRRGRALNRRELRLVRWFLGQFPRNALILDVPAGDGRFFAVAQECGHRILAVDNDPERLECARQRAELINAPVRFLQGDIFNLPLGDNAVDAALCVRLFHWFDPEQIQNALKELRRVAPHICLTYYSKYTLEGFQKFFRGYRGHAKNYTPDQILKWACLAGLRPHKKIPGNGYFRRCQFLWLS